jgi:SAM-dependent methyltransferase
MKKSIGWHILRGFQSLGKKIDKFNYRRKFPQFGNIDTFLKTLAAPNGKSRSLDIGCGDVMRNPFAADEGFGVDIREHLAGNVISADLTTENIPFANEFFDFVTAYDFIEHVPRISSDRNRRFPFVALMNEIHRVLKIDGYFLSVTPAYPFPSAFRDPTHINIITDETFPVYFDNKHRYAAMYGFSGHFSVIRQGWLDDHLVTVLQKADPAFPKILNSCTR